MHAYLLINPDTNTANGDTIEFARKQNAKVIPFALQKIEDARNLKKLVKFKFNEKTAIVINDIDLATNETLNAFLKNLEEPNGNLIYILSASNLENVLPTIVSRCEVVKSNSITKQNSATDQKTNKDIEMFLKLSVNQKIESVGKIKERVEAIKFIEDIIHYEHQNNRFENIENCLETIKNLRANGNVSLQLTNFVVRMSSTTN